MSLDDQMCQGMPIVSVRLITPVTSRHHPLHSQLLVLRRITTAKMTSCFFWKHLRGVSVGSGTVPPSPLLSLGANEILPAGWEEAR